VLKIERKKHKERKTDRQRETSGKETQKWDSVVRIFAGEFS
jgi:hypothetical protein